MGKKNLYWEAYSGIERNTDWIFLSEQWTDKDSHWMVKSLQNQINFVFTLLPVAVLWLPTIFLYVRIIQVLYRGIMIMVNDQPPHIFL